MEPSRDDLLVSTLESLRPAPSAAFTAELDERVAAGFPPHPGSGSSPLDRLAQRVRAMRPRQLALAGGGVALATIAIAAVIIVSSQSEPGGSALTFPGSVGSEAGNEHFAAPQTQPQKNFDGSGRYPSKEAGPASSSSAPSALLPESAGAAPSRGTGPYASGAKHRHVERAAEMVLGTEPGEVGEAAGKVLEAVHQYDGIVLNSSVRGGSEGDAGASFDLLIPSAKLSDALAAFSGIAEVRSRHEASNDITAPTNTISEGLQDSHAKIDALLNELAESETEAEREAAEAQLRSERRHAAALKSQLSNLQRRANLPHVSLQIETGGSHSGSGGGGWDVGDAFHDAGQILAVAAGVTIVGLAVLAPIALIGLLFWLGNRVWVRQRRERALG